MNIIDPTSIIAALATCVSVLAGLLWRTQVKETEFWKSMYLTQANKDKSALETLADWVRDQKANEGRRPK